MSVSTRLLSLDDAAVITDLVCRNREFLAPWEPARAEDYFTLKEQETIIGRLLEQQDTLPHVILDDGVVVGRITLNTIVRGPFQSCNLGYWVSADANGRGVATAAVREIIGVAFGEQGLHRIQAGVLLNNIRSQKVLERSGFVRYGMAPQYLSIAGAWQDHALYQLIAPGKDTSISSPPSGRA